MSSRKVTKLNKKSKKKLAPKPLADFSKHINSTNPTDSIDSKHLDGNHLDDSHHLGDVTADVTSNTKNIDDTKTDLVSNTNQPADVSADIKNHTDNNTADGNHTDSSDTDNSHADSNTEDELSSAQPQENQKILLPLMSSLADAKKSLYNFYAEQPMTKKILEHSAKLADRPNYIKLTRALKGGLPYSKYYYVVIKGKEPGVYLNKEYYEAQLLDFVNPESQIFMDKFEALLYISKRTGQLPDHIPLKKYKYLPDADTYYVVIRGRHPGIFFDPALFYCQIAHFENRESRTCSHKKDAIAYIKEHLGSRILDDDNLEFTNLDDIDLDEANLDNTHLSESKLKQASSKETNPESLNINDRDLEDQETKVAEIKAEETQEEEEPATNLNSVPFPLELCDDLPKCTKYYVVIKGRQPGVYFNGADYEAQLQKFKGQIKSTFINREEAIKYIKSYLNSNLENKAENRSTNNKVTTNTKAIPTYFPLEEAFNLPEAKKYYVILKGKKPGIYLNGLEYDQQLKGVKGQVRKTLSSKKEVITYIAKHHSSDNTKKASADSANFKTPVKIRDDIDLLTESKSELDLQLSNSIVEPTIEPITIAQPLPNKGKISVVVKGRKPGIYTSSKEAYKQVEYYKGKEIRVFDNKSEALKFANSKGLDIKPYLDSKELALFTKSPKQLFDFLRENSTNPLPTTSQANNNTNSKTETELSNRDGNGNNSVQQKPSSLSSATTPSTSTSTSDQNKATTLTKATESTNHSVPTVPSSPAIQPQVSQEDDSTTVVNGCEERALSNRNTVINTETKTYSTSTLNQNYSYTYSIHETSCTTINNGCQQVKKETKVSYTSELKPSFVTNSVNNEESKQKSSYSKHEIDQLNQQIEEEINNLNPYQAIAFIDGSCCGHNEDHKEIKISYGGCLFSKGKESEFAYATRPQYKDSASAESEILGAKHVIEMAIEKGFKFIKIYYDYQNIENWATRISKANSQLAKDYVAFYDQAKEKIGISFSYCPGHKDIKYNEQAHNLAQKALKSFR